MAARPTIRDISRLAGVSPTAVSFALNGRPGISESTRQRVLEIATSVGWHPSAAAIALSAGRAGALGLVIARPEDSFTNERFFMHLIAGVERVLKARSMSLLLQFAADRDEERAAHRMWHLTSKVDGVLLIDPQIDDPRPDELEHLGLPHVVVGCPPGQPYPGVEVDDDQAMRAMVHHLSTSSAGADHASKSGPGRLAYVAGDASRLHTRARMDAFDQSCTDYGQVSLGTTTTNSSQEAGMRAAHALLDAPTPPTGIIFDNEVLATGGILALRGRGVQIPGAVAVASFEDCPLYQILDPQITAMVRDPSDLGAQGAELLLHRLDGGTRVHTRAPAPTLVERGSTLGTRAGPEPGDSTPSHHH